MLEYRPLRWERFAEKKIRLGRLITSLPYLLPYRDAQTRPSRQELESQNECVRDLFHSTQIQFYPTNSALDPLLPSVRSYLMPADSYSLLFALNFPA
ncbi:unnamed protein product [Protopolystoma xenopodis]|uniref:Uncharacterized protein n=1 Tax=Protopolystoma xenopodis TaxID=117903 RepID=A0A448WQU2_9PLAT|nr:unnamed protein product [Protopolystoma xenopodis]